MFNEIFSKKSLQLKRHISYRRATIVADGKRAGGYQHPPAGLDGGQQEGQGLLHLRVLSLKNLRRNWKDAAKLVFSHGAKNAFWTYFAALKGQLKRPL
jgi:hypothetical protein